MKKGKSVLTLTITALALFAFALGSAQAASIDKDLSTGKIRIHYPTPVPSSIEAATLLGVGTAMSRSDYDNLANAIIGKGPYVVVIMDHVPGNMMKQDADKYRNCALEIQDNLADWIGTSEIEHWLVGGHSAGGEAAQKAVANDPTLADGIFSIDPYNSNNAGTVVLPAMYWGFNVTTCFVEKNDAAKAAYYGSADQRAFYRVKKKYSFNPCGYSPKYFHCSFADNHCPACTNCWYTPSSFFSDVAKSFKKFVNAAFYGSWSKSALSFSASTPLELFVDSDNP